MVTLDDIPQMPALVINSGFGHVVDPAGAKVAKLSEEHGQIDISARVAIIPNQICSCVNLHDSARPRSAETGRLNR